MIISVIERHINRGIRESCRRCPVALAMRDATGEPWEVDAIDLIPLHTDSSFARCTTPKDVANWIENFDAFDDADFVASPFSFQVNIEDNSKGGA